MHINYNPQKKKILPLSEILTCLSSLELSPVTESVNEKRISFGEFNGRDCKCNFRYYSLAPGIIKGNDEKEESWGAKKMLHTRVNAVIASSHR